MGMYGRMNQNTVGRGTTAAVAHVALLVYAALPPVALLLIRIYGDHGPPEGRCEGIGWGCAPSQSHAAALMFLFVLPVMVVWAAAATAVLALLRRRPGFRAMPALLQGLLPILPAYALLLALLLAAL